MCWHMRMQTPPLGAKTAIEGSLRQKLCHELGLKSLQQRRWFRKLCYFFKITENKFPKYLFDKVLGVLNILLFLRKAFYNS